MKHWPISIIFGMRH